MTERAYDHTKEDLTGKAIIPAVRFADLLRRMVDSDMSDADFRHLVRMNIAIVKRVVEEEEEDD